MKKIPSLILLALPFILLGVPTVVGGDFDEAAIAGPDFNQIPT